MIFKPSMFEIVLRGLRTLIDLKLDKLIEDVEKIEK